MRETYSSSFHKKSLQSEAPDGSTNVQSAISLFLALRAYSAYTENEYKENECFA